jgi:hypothetical protein
MKLIRKSLEMGYNGQVLTYSQNIDKRNIRLHTEKDFEMGVTTKSELSNLRKKQK